MIAISYLCTPADLTLQAAAIMFRGITYLSRQPKCSTLKTTIIDGSSKNRVDLGVRACLYGLSRACLTMKHDWTREGHQPNLRKAPFFPPAGVVNSDAVLQFQHEKGCRRHTCQPAHQGKAGCTASQGGREAV